MAEFVGDLNAEATTRLSRHLRNNARASAGRSDAENSFQKEQELRARAIESSRGVVSAAGQAATDLQEAGLAGQKAIRTRAAQGIAAAHGQAGGLQGGGAAASLRQTAIDRGTAQAEFGLAQTTAQNEANIFAQQAAVDQAVFEREAGTLAQDRREKMAMYNGEISKMVEAYEPGIFGIGGDEGLFTQKMLAMIDAEGDPELRQKLYDQMNATLVSVFGQSAISSNEAFVQSGATNGPSQSSAGEKTGNIFG